MQKRPPRDSADSPRGTVLLGGEATPRRSPWRMPLRAAHFISGFNISARYSPFPRCRTRRQPRSVTMGHAASKSHSDPSAYATPFVPESSSIVPDEVKSKWRTYDYVIVGGGECCSQLAPWPGYVSTVSSRYRRVCARVTAYGGPQYHSLASRGWREVCWGYHRTTIVLSHPIAMKASYSAASHSLSSVCLDQRMIGATERRACSIFNIRSASLMCSIQSSTVFA